MAGAILGITAETDPPVEVLDADLFRSEADRLAKIAHGGQPLGYRYPDLLYWSAPKALADALIRSKDGDLHVCGLGRAKAMSKPIASPKDDFAWQWLNLEVGQTLLIKRRKDLMLDTEESKTSPAPRAFRDSNKPSLDVQQVGDTRPPLVRGPRIAPRKPSERRESLDLQQALDYLAEHKNDDKSIGVALRRVVNKGTRGQIAAFTSALIDQLRQPSAKQTQ